MFILLAKGNYLIRAQLASCSFTIASRIILQKSCDFVFRKQRQRARARGDSRTRRRTRTLLGRGRGGGTSACSGDTETRGFFFLLKEDIRRLLQDCSRPALEK